MADHDDQEPPREPEPDDDFPELDAALAERIATIDEVSKLLTNDAMISMNKAVAIDKQPEADVAKQFLEANNLL